MSDAVMRIRGKLPGRRGRMATEAPQLPTVASSPPDRPGAPTSTPGAPRGNVGRTVRMLALAHKVACMVDAGESKDYASVAKLLGITRARLTQILNLLTLSPSIQKRILTGELLVSERRLRAVVREPDWRKQDELLRDKRR